MSYKIRVKNKEISSLKDWENAFNGGKLWKKGRSAYLLADFMLNRNGIKTITEILDRCGFCGIQFLSCDVEASVKGVADPALPTAIRELPKSPN